MGVQFHSPMWLGGYGSWPRRMVRLGHISFFGLALLNLAYALTVSHLQLTANLAAPSWLFIVAAITMPLICFLSAWRQNFRHLFFVPVASLFMGTGYLMFLMIGNAAG